MKLCEAIEIVEDYQLWRLGKTPYDYGQDGAKSPKHEPKRYTEAIDTLIYLSKQTLKESTK
jgi:hypothetical protein